MFKKSFFAVACLLAGCASTLPNAGAAEPPVIRESVEPPKIRECACDVCECPACDGVCTVPILADIPYNASHSCPRCGTFANIVERELAGGKHVHQCPSCRSEWWHADPGVSLPSVQYTVAPPSNPFALPGCADGSCARAPAIRAAASSGTVTRSYSSTSTRRVRLFSGERWFPGKLLLRRAFGGCR